MTLDELKARPEFVVLGPQQKDFVTVYCTNGAEKIAAAKVAYDTTSDESAEAIANRNLRHPAIKSLVKLWYEFSEHTGTKNEALAIIWTQIQSETDAKLKLDYLKLYGEWKGFKTDEDDSDEEPDDVDDIVQKMEREKKAK